MIYQVELPALTLKRLTDVVYLQMRLLRYAASRETLSRQTCERYLQGYKRFRGRHKQIADWLWRGSKRRKLLEDFAQGSRLEKLEWSRCLFREALAFLTNPVGSLTPYRKKAAPDWQQAGADFLRQFYEYLGQEQELPDYFFSERGATQFNKNNLKSNFFENTTNKKLQVCPACDFSPFSSSCTQVDHYLPISLYPHLSCHPFNLVPTCSDCNSLRVKKNHDVLQRNSGNRRQLEDIFLIYKDCGLGDLTYLKLELEKGYRSISLMELKPRKGQNLRDCIDAYCDAYQIPDRWLEIVKTIENQLFSQIKQSMKAARRYSQSLNIFDVDRELTELLQSLCEEQGRTPFAFAMSWWLATLIERELKPAISSSQPIEVKNFPLLEEIADWIRQDNIQHPAYTQEPHLKQARNLRKIVAEEG
ncbi:MAG: HNH endonuclease signature motif containing protein [Coleofasciculus sp. C1-SOL-03]|uniref:HNH endonuclease signature motif containing protein n=1 Tax=Coleofasciculus sp. C1-SOL-03 TaxID=3069522 RepID=UPI0032F0FD3D